MILGYSHLIKRDVHDEGRMKAAALGGLPKTSVPRKHRTLERNHDPGLYQVSIKEHQLQGNRDPSTVFTFPYFVAVLGVLDWRA